ncbi:MAG: glycosyl hydrolase 53 family protein [Bacteroidales bacterium]|nr:glycosyl hydrolase 53 family protein [Bacteroidales bacterium]
MIQPHSKKIISRNNSPYFSIMFNKLFPLLSLLLVLALTACEDETSSGPEQPFYKAADISSLPEIKTHNIRFYNSRGDEESFTDILKNHGINTLRLKLWVNPENPVNGLEEVAAFSDRLRSQGFKNLAYRPLFRHLCRPRPAENAGIMVKMLRWKRSKTRSINTLKTSSLVSNPKSFR